MANIVVEFDVRIAKPNFVLPADKKVCKLTIRDYPDEHVLGLSSGDEIGFDLVESSEFFYVTVSRKACIVGQQQPIYVICVPSVLDGLDEVAAIVEKFKEQFGDQLTVEN